MNYTFNAKKEKENLVAWIKDYFERTATPETKAVIGISGGKDSTIVARLCAEALGKDRVVGVMLPMGDQENLLISNQIIKSLGIRGVTLNIENEANHMVEQLQLNGVMVSPNAIVNLLPRIRMTKLYLVSQSLNGRVSNNSNLSETVMGFSTKWGDGVGDFSPLENLTVDEVCQIGIELGLPHEWVYRVPQDDLNYTYKDGVKHIYTDEDVLGVKYSDLDKVIRGDYDEVVSEVIELIKAKASQNMFKRKPIESYSPDLPVSEIAAVK